MKLSKFRKRRGGAESLSGYFPLDRAGLIAAYRTMRTIRAVETFLHEETGRGGIAGFVHLAAGQEATAAGVIMNLTERDKIASTHRGHGHLIAKGMEIKPLLAEIFGKAWGCGGGKGGSMHMADRSRGILGTNGISGAGAPLICGAALAARLRRDGTVGVAFLGDGASNQGTVLESLNLAAVWNLPAIFVIENNGYACSTPRDYAVAVNSYVDRAAGFGMPGVSVDGLDFFAVYEAAGEMIARAREGGGPALLDCKVIRIYGHYEGDTQAYRAPGEIDDILAHRDCIASFTEQVLSAGALDCEELKAVDLEIEVAVSEAADFARAAPYPAASELTTDVYANAR